MKKFIVLVLLTFTALTAYSQAKEEKLTTINTVSAEARYKLYPTSNINIFLKLDTRTGKLWMVQWSTNSNQMQVELSTLERCLSSEQKNGRFSLYPTTNIYNFLMIDHENGKVWQVQWSIEPENRMVLPIPAN